MRRGSITLVAILLGGCLAQPAAVSGDSIAWDAALALIYSGRVAVATQSPDLGVALVTRDGRVLHTREPEIDAIFAAIETCGRTCAGMQQATE